MTRTLEQLLEQEKPEVAAEAKRNASEMLHILDEQTAKQDHSYGQRHHIGTSDD